MRNTTFLFSACLLLAASAAFAEDQGPRRGPPAESLAACNGLADGAACGFTHDGRNLTGTCRTGPQGAALACRPEGMHGGRHHAPPPEALSACQGQADGATCSFSIESKTINGTCKTPRDGSALACRPAHHREGRKAHRAAAVEACAGSTAGAACSSSLREKTVAGTCQSREAGAPLACRPERR